VLAALVYDLASATAAAVRLFLRTWLQRERERWRTLGRLFEFERARVKLHTNASGDFELLARADWARTSGYAELEMYSMHLDSLHMYMAYWSGIREAFLPYRVYHLEHEDGFKPDPVGAGRLNEQLDRREIPQISNEQLFDWILEMARSRKPLAFNSSGWGLADEVLLETTIGSGTVDAGRLALATSKESGR
jgi:hypothetical protein